MRIHLHTSVGSAVPRERLCRYKPAVSMLRDEVHAADAEERNVDFGVPMPPAGQAFDDGIVYWFRPTTVPVGGAPLDIRQRWIGVPLPVRRPRPVEGPESYVGRDVVDRQIQREIPDGVRIDINDATAALRYFG